MFRNLFTYFKSLFTTKQAETEDYSVTVTEINQSEPAAEYTPEVTVSDSTDVTVETPVTEPVVETKPLYTDVFGNALNLGDQVVRIKYNEYNRRGYMSIRTDYSATPYTLQDVRSNVIKYDTLMELTANNKVKAGRKSGYLHIVAEA